MICKYLKIGAFVFIPQLGALPSAIITRGNMDWYEKEILRPSYRPPNWLFGPMWTSLYAMMGYASYRIYSELGFTEKAMLPLGSYACQLVLNWAWTPLFFGFHQIGLASMEMTATYGMVIYTIYQFHQVDHVAAKLLYPYITWLSLAWTLNFHMFLMNRNSKKDA